MRRQRDLPQGLFRQHPKSAAFYGSIFAVALPPHAPVWFSAAIFAIATSLSALWYCGGALLRER